MSWYNPKPPRNPLRLPRRVPKRTVPSYIGEPGLVGGWIFYNDTRGTLYDFSGEENHGDIAGAEWVDGSWGWALDFPGTDQYVEIPTFSEFSEFTVIVWSKHRSVSDGDMDDIFNLRQNNGVILRDEGDGNMYAYIYDGSWHSFSESISNDTWNMWTARYDGSVFEGFKNEPPSFGSYSTDAYTGRGTDNHAIGAAEPDLGNEYLDGVVALCWLYDVAKPNSFIEEVFRKTRGIFKV